MPPLSSLIPQKWPDIQIDAPLGSGACGTVYACTKKSAATGIESREAVKVVRVEFSAAAHRQAEEEGIPFDEYYARIKAEKSREIELLVNLKSPHIVHINEFDAVEEPDHSAFYLLIRMDLLQALTAFRVDHLTDTPEQAGAYARKATKTASATGISSPPTFCAAPPGTSTSGISACRSTPPRRTLRSRRRAPRDMPRPSS